MTAWILAWLIRHGFTRLHSFLNCKLRRRGCDFRHRYNLTGDCGRSLEGVYRCAVCGKARIGAPK